MHKIKTSLPNTLNPLQFAYRPNRSTDDAISSTLQLALTHLENKDSYVRMQFIDFSSAFNTIIPQQLINKLNPLGLKNSLCNWILDFLTSRPQSVHVGHNTSSTTTLRTGAPQGCVLSPLLFTLLTHICTAKFSSNHIINFADDTTVVGLISNTRLRASLPLPILTTFYRGTIESVLTSCITVWYGNCSAADRKTLQQTVNTAAKIIGAPLPSILDIFLARCSSKTNSIVNLAR